MSPIWLRRASIMLCVLAATAAASAAASTPRQSLSPSISEKPPTAAISGVVTDATTGQPVAGAVVSLGDVDGLARVLPRVVTDARGRFVFRDLPASKGYFLGARRFGYAYTRWGWTSPGQSLATADIARIPLIDGQWVNNITIPLWRLGSISGRVVDERGEPVVGTAVRIFSLRPISGVVQPVAGDIAVTDDRGIYRIANVEPWRYVVALLSVQSTVLASTPEATMRRAVGELDSGGIGAGRGNAVAAPGIDVDGTHRLVMTNFATPPPPGNGSARAYPPIFYPAAQTFADAVPIEIGYGDTRNNVDFQLQPVATVRVSGRTESGSGEVPNLLLRLLPVGSEMLGFGSEVATTPIGPDGRFTFLNVPPGSYTIVAQSHVMDFTSGSNSTRFSDAPGFPAGGIAVGSKNGVPGLGYLLRRGSTAALWGRTAVAVGSADIDNLVVRLRPTISISGRMAFAEGTVPPQRRPYLSAQPANGDPSLGEPESQGSADQSDFNFTIRGLLAGRYILTSLNFTSLGIVSVIWRGRDVTDSGFDASLGIDFDDIVVTLTDKTIALGGTVRNPPANGAAVMAFPVDAERWRNYGWTAVRFRSTRAGANGSYQLQYLPEGEYYVIAVDRTLANAWTDPAFLAAAVPQATRVSLKWGDRKTIDVGFVEMKNR